MISLIRQNWTEENRAEDPMENSHGVKEFFKRKEETITSSKFNCEKTTITINFYLVD